jgi:cell division septum initiation protein DivIVA
VSEFLDVIVAALLVFTIAYAVVLNKRLAALRKDREALEKLASDFAAATARAENGIKRLKDTSAEASAAVKKNLGDARELRDDLAYLVERGETAADRLEASVRAARDLPGPRPGKSGKELPKFDGVNDDGPDVLSPDAERELLQALRAAR